MEVAPTESGLEQDQDGFARSIYRRLLSRGETPPRAFGLPYGMWGDPIDTARQGRALATWSEQAAGEPTLIRAAVPIRVGGETAGALLVEEGGEQLVLVRELANGWTYQLSQWIAYTADHKTFEGVGLAPDIYVKGSSSISATDAVLERAIQLAQ